MSLAYRVLLLPTPLADQLVSEARAALPHECCGLLVGRGHDDELQGASRTVTRVIALPNAADAPSVSFVIAERPLAHALMALEHSGEQLIGFYHSHPQGDPIPSQADIRAAAYPEAAHLIIGLRGGQPRLAAWQIAYEQVERLELHVGDIDSVRAASLHSESSGSGLNSAQITAVLISALVVTLLVLTISLSLLPPAPLIPGR